jgi:hypothetical protein
MLLPRERNLIPPEACSEMSSSGYEQACHGKIESQKKNGNEEFAIIAKNVMIS